MITKTFQRSIRLLSVPCSSFGLGFLQRKYTLANFDILITDIQPQDLHSQISDKLNKKYLSPLLPEQKEIEKIRSGISYGIYSKWLITLPTRYCDRDPIWVHYLISTVSPASFLTKEAIRALIGPNATQYDQIVVKINGKNTPMRTSTNHFHMVNIIGMDFIKPLKSLKYNLLGSYSNLQAIIEFDNN